jgi:hypothetical protein
VSQKNLDIDSDKVILSKKFGQFSCTFRFTKWEASCMADTDVKIVVAIKNYIELHGGNYLSWYVGRAEHPEEKLVDHGVTLDLDRYIYLTATCIDDAKSVEQYFVTRLGTDGHARGGNGGKALSIYAYKKNPATQP